MASHTLPRTARQCTKDTASSGEYHDARKTPHEDLGRSTRLPTLHRGLHIDALKTWLGADYEDMPPRQSAQHFSKYLVSPGVCRRPYVLQRGLCVLAHRRCNFSWSTPPRPKRTSFGVHGLQTVNCATMHREDNLAGVICSWKHERNPFRSPNPNTNMSMCHIGSVLKSRCKMRHFWAKLLAFDQKIRCGTVLAENYVAIAGGKWPDNGSDKSVEFEKGPAWRAGKWN